MQMKTDEVTTYPAYIGRQEVFTDQTFPAIEASTGKTLAYVSRCNVDQVNAAVQVASAAQVAWQPHPA